MHSLSKVVRVPVLVVTLLSGSYLLSVCDAHRQATDAAVHSAKYQANYPSQIVVGPNVQVSREDEKSFHHEVILAADPEDSRRLLAGSIVRVSPQVDVTVAYASTDTGRTWRLVYAPKGPNGKTAVLFDPAVTFGSHGVAYFASLFNVDVPGPHVPESYLEVSRSPDGGANWDPPTRIEGFNDRPYLVTDGTTGAHRGRLYCVSGLNGGGHGIRTSDDQGKTFRLSGQARLRVPPPNQALNTGQSVVLSDGSLVIPYLYFLKGAGTQKEGLTGGDVQAAGLTIRRSTDGGISLLPDSLQIAACRHTDRDGLPMLAASAGDGRFKDYLCLVWSDALPTGHRVLFAYSQDRGASWSRPLLLSEQSTAVSEDGKPRKDAPPNNPYDAFLPSVAINRSGVVGVWWYDTRALPNGTDGWDVRFRASVDGGKTWPPSVKVTTATSVLTAPRDAHAGDISWVGDTAGIATDAKGLFHLLWIDNRTRVRQVFTAGVSVEASDGAKRDSRPLQADP